MNIHVGWRRIKRLLHHIFLINRLTNNENLLKIDFELMRWNIHPYFTKFIIVIIRYSII